MLCCFHPEAAPNTLLTAHLTCFTFLQPSYTQRRPAAHAPLRVSDKVVHQSSVPMGPPSRILRIPIIPWCVSWLFLTWSTCCLIGMWPHSTPISWVPAFDFHCGLTGLLIMQHNVVRWAGSNHCKLSPCQLTTPPGEHAHPKLRNRASSYRQLSFKHAHTGGRKSPALAD